MLNVALIIGHATSKRIEAVVDSGSPFCLFHASIAKALGLNLKNALYTDKLGGVVGGATADVHYHAVKLKVMAEIIGVTAGFSPTLGVAAILGRHGFFDNYQITFDPCSNPPGLVLERIGRA